MKSVAFSFVYPYLLCSCYFMDETCSMCINICMWVCSISVCVHVLLQIIDDILCSVSTIMIVIKLLMA